MIGSILSGNSSPEYSESSGYYERVPIRVGEFVLTTNEAGTVEFETTSQEFCDEGPALTVHITESDGWSVEVTHGCYHWNVTPSADLSNNRLARRRAFWHAAQYMAGRDLSKRERFLIGARNSNDGANVFEDDAFFKDGDSVTTDPFGEFLAP